MAIIGLIGFKQVGKSTAAKYLQGKYDFSRHNFKDALVAEIKQNFPDLLRELSIIYSMTVDELFENKPPAMRALMQNYGTQVRRGDRDLYWVEQWVNGCLALPKIVVDDVRFLNEAEAVKKLGGILIRLTRPDITSGGTHSSETNQLEIVADHTIECKAGEHETLYAALDKIILPLEN